MKLVRLCTLLFALWELVHFEAYAQNALPKKNHSPARSENRIHPTQKKTYLKGKVLDKLSNEPIVGVAVKLLPKNIICYTDLNGEFEFSGLPPDNYHIEIQHIGYKKAQFLNISTMEKPYAEVILHLDLMLIEADTAEVVQKTDISKFSEAYSLLLKKNTPYYAENQPKNQLESENFDYAIATSLQRMRGACFLGGQSFIRGLPERYNAVLLHYAPLLSLDYQRYYYNLQEIPTWMVSNLKLLKSTTSEYYANYGGGAILIETEAMPQSRVLKLQWNGFYHTLSTFQKLNSFPFNRKWIWIQETQNIPTPQVPQAAPAYIPNDFKARHYTALWNSQWNMYYANRLNVLKNRKLGMVIALSFWDYYHRTNFTGSEINSLQHDTLFSTPILKSSYDQHQQHATAIANLSLKWNNRNFLYSRNTVFYKNYNTVFFQSTHYQDFINQRFQRDFIYAQQNSGEHSLVSKKDRSLKLEWLQFYHYYYQQTPASFSWFFQQSAPYPKILALPDTPFVWTQKNYQQNLLYSDKQQLHQLGGDLHFDVMAKEEDNKAKSRIGSFLNYTCSYANARNFYHQFRGNPSDSSALIMDADFFLRTPPSHNESLFQIIETTDSSHYFHSQHLNIAPYLNIEYELTEIFRFIVGFRIDFSFRYFSNFYRKNSLVLYAQNDLPSIVLLFQLNEKSQLRLNYMLNVTRPSDRDLMGSRYFHSFMQILQLPNPSLYSSSINHLEMQYELFPSSTDAFSAGLFFKQIQFPIENEYSLPDNPQNVITSRAINAYASILAGAEIEWKQNLGKLLNTEFWKNCSISWNAYASLSNTKQNSQQSFWDSSTRPLQGHSFYGANIGLSWANEKLGLKVMSFLNYKGKSIVFLHSDPKWYLWELPRTEWSFQLAQSIRERWELRLAVFNLLNSPIQWAYLTKYHYFQNQVSHLYRQQKLGLSFLFSVNFRLEP